ncbi:MAG: hypothetical protein WBX26_01325, partial [Candidatus Cybelea sp.]
MRDALFLAIRDCIGRYDDSINYISGSYAGNRYWAYYNQELLTTSDEYHTFRQRGDANAYERIYAFF